MGRAEVILASVLLFALVNGAFAQYRGHNMRRFDRGRSLGQISRDGPQWNNRFLGMRYRNRASRQGNCFRGLICKINNITSDSETEICTFTCPDGFSCEQENRIPGNGESAYQVSLCMPPRCTGEYMTCTVNNQVSTCLKAFFNDTTGLYCIPTSQLYPSLGNRGSCCDPQQEVHPEFCRSIVGRYHGFNFGRFPRGPWQFYRGASAGGGDTPKRESPVIPVNPGDSGNPGAGVDLVPLMRTEEENNRRVMPGNRRRTFQ